MLADRVASGCVLSRERWLQLGLSHGAITCDSRFIERMSAPTVSGVQCGVGVCFTACCVPVGCGPHSDCRRRASKQASLVHHTGWQCAL